MQAERGRVVPVLREHAPEPAASARRGWVLPVLAVAAVVVVAGFLTIGVAGSWSYALELRSRKVAAMVVVAGAVSCSTVLFQTVTTNRILTPSIIGFDSLYVLIQSVTVYAFGSLALARLGAEAMFAVDVAAMVAFAGALHRWVFGRHSRDLYVLVLVGIVFGTLFSSLSSLVNRMIDPNEFVALQDRLFASVNSVDQDLLGISALVVAAAIAYAWRMAPALDVVALGREHAVNLGVDHRGVVTRVLVVVAVLVSVATALVGPITFFGLLVANLARHLTGTFRHRAAVPAAALLGVIALVGGQLVLEQGFGFDTSLSVIVNFVGGTYFIALLLKEARP